MRNSLTLLALVFLISCTNKEENDRDNIANSPPIEPIGKVVFAVDKLSEEYQLFLDEEGKIKQNISVIVGTKKFPLDEVIKEISNHYFEKTSNSKENTYIGFTTKGGSTGDDPGFKVLTYVLPGTSKIKPTYITIDDEKKFKIIVTKEPSGTNEYGKFIVNTDIFVNKQRTKLIFGGQPIVILNN